MLSSAFRDNWLWSDLNLKRYNSDQIPFKAAKSWMNPSGTNFLNIRGFMKTAVFSNVANSYNEISSKFYVVAYMFVSHEQEVDYKHFLSSLLQLTVDLNVQLCIDYLVQDA